MVNETIFLTDRNPFYLWRMGNDDTSRLIIQADMGYKIAVTVFQCSISETEPKSYIQMNSGIYNIVFCLLALMIMT